VIPGDIGRELGLRASGTWRPAPGGGPATYATSLPFLLAERSGGQPATVAAGLARRLRRAGWISAAAVTGGGYLTVTVTDEALAALAVRVPAAGAGCAASDSLHGTRVSAPSASDDDLARSAGWPQARALVAGAVTGRLARAAGAVVDIRGDATCSSADAGRRAPAGPAAAVAFAGADAVRYALARAGPVARADQLDAGRWARHRLSNPFFAVRYAHAHAASVLRWAADLDSGPGDPDAMRAGLLAHPTERALLGLLSWMPERTGAAARRARPDVFARYLESLAGAWLDCGESRPALPFGGRAAPRDGPGTSARLWLAAAAATALRAGLDLIGLAAPERL
jgi:arginyl-tRNA synthetase